MNFNRIPEEQENPELVNNLQEAFRMSPEKKAILARIEARLLQNAQTQIQTVRPREPLEAVRHQYQYLHENVVYPRSPRSWQQRLGLFAVVLVVLLITAATVSTFVLIKNKGQLASVPSPQTTGQSTTSPLSSHQLMKYAYIIGGGVRMVTEQAGWAMNTAPDNSVFHTTDGGKIWKQITPPAISIEDIVAVDVFDENMAFIRLQSDHQHFYRTADGGATWQLLVWPDLPASNQRLGFDVTFLDYAHGWVCVIESGKSSISSNGVIKPQKQTLFRTDDGGQSWQQVAPLPPDIDGVTVTFTSLYTGWFATPGPSPTFSLTRDGGRTWKQQFLPVPQQGSYDLKDLEELTFSTEREGYLLATFGKGDSQGERYLYTTQDGGSSWQRIGPALPQQVIVKVVDATHLLLLESGGVENRVNTARGFLLTLINGQWIQVANKLAVKDYASMDFISAQSGLALVRVSGTSTDVYRTEDGGKNWQKVGNFPKGA